MSLSIAGEKPPAQKNIPSSQNVARAADLQDLQTQKIARKTFKGGGIPRTCGFLPDE